MSLPGAPAWMVLRRLVSGGGGGPPGRRYVPVEPSWSVRAVVGLENKVPGEKEERGEAVDVEEAHHRVEAEAVDLERLGRLAAVDLGDTADQSPQSFARKLRADLANMLRFLAHVKRDQGLDDVRPMWSPMDSRAVRLRDGVDEADDPHADTIPQDDLLRLPRRVYGNLYYVPTSPSGTAVNKARGVGHAGGEEEDAEDVEHHH